MMKLIISWLILFIATVMCMGSAVAKSLEQLDATTAAAMLGSGEISSTELVTALLERIAEYDDLNAFITLDAAGALRQAAGADEARKQGSSLGRLHGVPVIIKDNIDVAGLPTTAGTPGMLDVRPKTDAAIVALLKAEGAVILGKSNLHELGFGISCDNAYFGPVRNPYNPAYITGGSSGGNAAALAAHLAPLAIGSDTGGSIRIPASLCGVYGYRPSVGRYPVQGFIPMAATKDAVGPMARTASDLVLVDAIVNDYAPAAVKPMELEGLRLGVPRYPLWQNLDAETAAVMEATLQKLTAAGVELVYADLPLPNIFELNRYVDYYIVLHECRRDFPGYLAPYGLTVTKLAAQIIDADIRYYFREIYLNPNIGTQPRYDEVMLKYRQIMVHSWQQYFTENKVAFIISPTTILPARPLADSAEHVILNGQKVPTAMAYLQNTGLSSNVGFAGVSVPAGFTSQGLPVGLEVDTLPGNDFDLLRLILSLETCLQTPLCKNN